MKTIKFPKMFNSNSTNCFKASEYREATKQSTFLLFMTERGALECDPYFGLPLRYNFLYGQNSYILAEAFKDMIYTQLALFIPQIKVERGDIEIIRTKQKGKIYCKFSGINQVDYKLDTQTLVLEEENSLGK